MLLFSDLHLSPKTFETCMKVLRRVHALAVEHEVPVGFLGDFFDHVYNKGTLPVDILNELLRYFSTEWHVPMIMIPGNHDYFDAEETEHGLTPFLFASKHITVLDKATVLDNRLWIPWRRDSVTCKRIIDAHPNVDVIFGHFDIVGFKLNASRISTEGLSTSMFSEEMPVYTGHYHTPQNHKNIHYLGSPYQLTLSEAEDNKSLVLLKADGSILRRIPIDIGRKQYKWTTEVLVQRASELQKDDRVSVSGGEIPVRLVTELRDRGIDVQIKQSIVQPVTTRISQPGNLSSLELMGEFARINKLDPTQDAWILLLEQLKTQNSTTLQSCKTVLPVRMTVSGFGPFVGPVTVPLQSQGFTLVSGSKEDDDASNGAGKSMITTGALLWAITGMIDGRSSLSWEASSVCHQNNGMCKVVVSGFSNNVAWEITRTLVDNPRRKHTLNFTVDSVDRTRSTIAATQRACVSEIFGLDLSGSEMWQWLLRNAIWSQEAVTRFCDAPDTLAKQEIQSLSNMGLWITLHSWAKDTLKQEIQSLKMAQNTQSMAKERYDYALVQREKNLLLKKTWDQSHSERTLASSMLVKTVRESYEQVTVLEEMPCKIHSDQMVKQKRQLVSRERTRLDRLTMEKELILRELPKDWRNVTLVETLPFDMGDFQRREQQCKSSMTARQVQLTQAKDSLTTFENKGHCSECQRPFDRDIHYHKHHTLRHSTLESARCLHSNAVREWKESIVTMKVKKVEFEAQQLREKITKAASSLEKIELGLSLTVLKQLEQDVESYATAWRSESRACSEYASTVQRKEELKRALDCQLRSHTSLCSHVNPHDTSETKVQQLLTELGKAENNTDEFALKVSSFQKILTWSGPRGIQTYVMEHQLQKLAALTTVWLQKFFNRTDIRLDIWFDEKERLQRRVVCPDCTGPMSGGQYKRVQLASFMAWKSMTASEFPLLIMDEPCQSMDQPGIRSVQETLREWCEEDSARSCFFITHDSGQHRDASIYQNHVRVVQKRGRSSLVDDYNIKRQKIKY